MTPSRPAPPAPDAAAWGDRRLTLDVAGGPFHFAGLSDEQCRLARDRFGAFIVGDEPDPAEPTTLHFLRAPSSSLRYPALEGVDYPLSLKADASRVTVDGLCFTAEIPMPLRSRTTVRTSVANGDELLAVLENPLRVLVAYRLLELGGALVHSAAAVDDDGRVLVFHGRSGAGKSTLSRLAASSGHAVLSDDLNTLVRHGGATFARPVPFAGDIRAPAPGGELPVRALLRLEKGAEVRARRTSPGASLASLIACSPFVNADPHRSPILEDNLERAQSSTPVGELTFPRDADFDDILRAVEAIS